MVGITLSPEQIRTAPPEVRKWLEHELLVSLGVQPPSAQPAAPHLVACGVDEAAQVLSLIQGMIPVVNVFFELGRDGASVGVAGLEAFRLVDILRHTRLQNLQQVVACLDTINEAIRRIRSDADAIFYALDDRGYCLIAEQTQRSILRIWQEIVEDRDIEASPVTTTPHQGTTSPAPSVPWTNPMTPSYSISVAPQRPAGAAPDTGVAVGRLADVASLTEPERS